MGDEPFTVETPGGVVSRQISTDGKSVKVNMGEVSFHSAVIPVIQIEIWERGAGYTLATDSSSMAVAGVALKLGLCDADITVHMPGGSLNIQFRNGFRATMTGPVTKVCDGVMTQEMFKGGL